MYYGAIKKYDIANGPGVRVSLFVSGCTNRCAHCFQPETWDVTYGQPYTEESEQEILQALASPYIKGLTVLGGEPFEFENQKVLVKLLRKVRKELPEKDIWCFTGFTLDEDLIVQGKRYGEDTDEMLSLIDVLVDGRFIEELKDITLRFRGSSNQRLIDMKKTRECHHIVLMDEKR